MTNLELIPSRTDRLINWLFEHSPFYPLYLVIKRDVIDLTDELQAEKAANQEQKSLSTFRALDSLGFIDRHSSN